MNVSLPQSHFLRAVATSVLLAAAIGVCFAFPTQSRAQATAPAIVIDPGHGGDAYAGSSDARTLSSPNNATSRTGIREKDLTLELSKKIVAVITDLSRERAVKVRTVLTRETDRNLDFEQRANICAGATPVAAIVSIHFNASQSHRANGSVVMIRQRDRNPSYDSDHAFAVALAETCADAIRPFYAAAKARAPITDAHLHGGRGSNFFHQLARHPELARVPKGFLEVEFLDNPEVEAALLGEKRDAALTAIAGAIARHLVELAAADRTEE